MLYILNNIKYFHLLVTKIFFSSLFPHILIGDQSWTLVFFIEMFVYIILCLIHPSIPKQRNITWQSGHWELFWYPKFYNIVTLLLEYCYNILILEKKECLNFSIICSNLPRGSYVNFAGVCTSIYRPLSYPFVSLPLTSYYLVPPL